jgi:riboflavin kinase/FMN adenylyltransferase
LELLQLSPEEFFAKIVQGDLAAQALVEGTNFFFGHNRAGTIEVLRGLTTEAGVQLDVVEPLLVDGEPVSSSRVRRLIAAGDIETAAELLTQPYRICGVVAKGAGRGASIGFPTANLSGVATLLPGQGVYAGRAQLVGDGEPGASASWRAAINVGPNPTFGENAVKVEAHLIGCAEPLYGKRLAVDFIARLRDIQPFPNVDALKVQLARDVAVVRTMEINPAE